MRHRSLRANYPSEATLANAHAPANPNLGLLTGIASTLECDYGGGFSDWRHSRFGWILPLPSARKGAIGKRLISGLLEEWGFSVRPCRGRGVDRLVNGRRVAMKFSMLWEEGAYKFQQIRDQRYEILICLGVSPSDAHSWVFTRDFLLEGWGNLEGFSSQHRGQEGRDTAWIHVNPAAPQAWLEPHGGGLQDALEALSLLLRELAAARH